MMRHKEAKAQLAAPPQAVFAHLDDQTRLASHMGKPSLMMGGGRMSYELDELKGQAVGSHIRMNGSAFGLHVSLEEVVTERTPPDCKAWRTIGYPKLIVIGLYEMGFEIDPIDGGSELRVWINYELPKGGLGRLFPALGDAYARWCVNQMVSEAAGVFGRIDKIHLVTNATNPKDSD